MEQLIEYLIQKELHELQYDNVQAWFAYLQRIIRLHSIKPEDWARIAELKATRDVFAHNHGIANDIYVRKAGHLARAQPGQRLTLSRPYLYGSSKPSQNSLFKADTRVRSVAENGILGLVLGLPQVPGVQTD
jgi:hypothetical protein